MTKVYAGRRTRMGCLVTVDGRELPTYSRLRCYCPDGFEWDGDENGESQLALAILADYWGQWHLEHFALPLVDDFRELVIDWLPHDCWVLTEDQVTAAIRAILHERGAQSQIALLGAHN